MNKIILIGNGFDKALGLPTLYGDFMQWFLNKLNDNINLKIEDINLKSDDNIKFKLENEISSFDYRDDFISIHTFNSNYIRENKYSVEKLLDNINDWKSYRYRFGKQFWNGSPSSKEILSEPNGNSKHNDALKFNNSILEILCKNYLKSKNQNWGNIEQIFYDELIKCDVLSIEKLNNDFEAIIKQLEIYLKSIDIENIIEKHSKEELDYIKNYIYTTEFDQKYFCPKFVKNTLKKYFTELLNVEDKRYIEEYNNKHGSCDSLDSYINHAIINNVQIDEYFDISFKSDIDNYLFLNFNYTDTHKYFVDNQIYTSSINIHGDLTDNPNTPIIFGFGDELDKNYKELEDKNNDEFLRYIKSINYLRNENYRKLNEYLEIQPYQVIILGHSCGTSDRTLLNTIFEHDNCVSIIPFIRTDQDDYQDRIINIYRNFTDKKKLRDRVVNKELCKKLTLDELKCNLG